MGEEGEMTLRPFRTALGQTRLILAGGCKPDDFERSISSGTCDLVAFGRFFVRVKAVFIGVTVVLLTRTAPIPISSTV